MTQNDLITRHIPLVHRLAKNLNAPHQREDLIGVGMVELVKTANRYGSSYGVTFSAYAKRWIRKAMIRHLQKEHPSDVSIDEKGPMGVPHSAAIGGDGQAERCALMDALSYYLHPVEEWVILKRYFGKMRIDDIASEIGFKVSRVSQIHSNAITKLKKAFCPSSPSEDVPQEESDDRDQLAALLQVVKKMMWDEWGLEVEL